MTGHRPESCVAWCGTLSRVLPFFSRFPSSLQRRGTVDVKLKKTSSALKADSGTEPSRAQRGACRAPWLLENGICGAPGPGKSGAWAPCSLSCCRAQCWDAGPSPASSTSAPGRSQPLCHADALLSEHNWNRVPPQAVPVPADIPVWGVYLRMHYLGGKKTKQEREINNCLLQVSGSSTWGMPSSSNQPRPPCMQEAARPRGCWSQPDFFFFFFKRGPISFTNEGPTVPGRICYGPARRPGGFVLPSAPTGAHCPRPQRGLLAADLSGPASRGPGPPLRSWPRRWGLSPGDL